MVKDPDYGRQNEQGSGLRHTKLKRIQITAGKKNKNPDCGRQNEQESEFATLPVQCTGTYCLDILIF